MGTWCACPAGLKIALYFLHLFVYLFVCVSTLITCAIITYIAAIWQCNFNLVNLMAALQFESRTVTSSTYQGAEAIQTKAEHEQKRQKWTGTCDTHRAANQLRVAARRELEWIGTFLKVRLVFRYEISDLCFWKPNQALFTLFST